jgi:hypothetical protein
VSAPSAGQAPRSVSPRDFHAGDIVFFAPADLRDPQGFAAFAAKVQTFPYDEPHPWPHVAVALGPGRIVDFEPTSAASHGPWQTKLNERGLRDETGTALTGIRFPDEIGAAIAANAAGMVVDTTYAVPGILAFAAASLARLFTESGARRKSYRFAYGVESIARRTKKKQNVAHGHTCVTAAAKAVTEAGVSLTVTEPPPPRFVVHGRDPKMAGQIQAIRALFDYAWSSRSQPVRDALLTGLVATPDEPVLSEEEFLTAVPLGDELVASGPADMPGPLYQRANLYFDVLRQSILSIEPEITKEEILEVGRDHAERLAEPTEWIVSPAMLYEALVAAHRTD